MTLGTEELLRSGRLIDIFPDWPDEIFPLYAIFPSRFHRTAKVNVFTDFCVRLLGADDRAGRTNDREESIHQ
jgi:DNA-binding transcriptional LysR family regulator